MRVIYFLFFLENFTTTVLQQQQLSLFLGKFYNHSGRVARRLFCRQGRSCSQGAGRGVEQSVPGAPWRARRGSPSYTQNPSDQFDDFGSTLSLNENTADYKRFACPITKPK